MNPLSKDQGGSIMQSDLRPPTIVPTPTLPVVTYEYEHFLLVLDELKEQQQQVQGLLDQLEQVGQTNDYLFMMTQQMNEASLSDCNEWQRTASEQQIISLEQLEGYVLQQRAQLQRYRSELEGLQAKFANQQQALLTYQFRLERLLRPASGS
jgi:tRNA splicing ligase